MGKESSTVTKALSREWAKPFGTGSIIQTGEEKWVTLT
jgi:hypothetical protein